MLTSMNLKQCLLGTSLTNFGTPPSQGHTRSDALQRDFGLVVRLRTGCIIVLLLRTLIVAGFEVESPGTPSIPNGNIQPLDD